MDKEYIVRRVKAKLNFKKKFKELKDKIIKKKFTSLNEENAIAYAKELGKEHYWGFDVKKDPKATKRTYQGVQVIDVEVENSRDKFGDAVTIWFDPVLGELYGNYKVSFNQSFKNKPAFHFTPLTEENAIAYAKSVGGFKIDDSKKVKKVKEQGFSLIEVPIEENGHPDIFTVWYDPGHMGLYGEG